MAAFNEVLHKRSGSNWAIAKPTFHVTKIQNSAVFQSLIDTSEAILGDKLEREPVRLFSVLGELNSLMQKPQQTGSVGLFIEFTKERALYFGEFSVFQKLKTAVFWILGLLAVGFCAYCFAVLGKCFGHLQKYFLKRQNVSRGRRTSPDTELPLTTFRFENGAESVSAVSPKVPDSPTSSMYPRFLLASDVGTSTGP